MRLTTLRATLRGRMPLDSERGSMPFLMLVIILSAALGAVLLSTVLSQTRTARFNESRVQALDAAQAGLDFGLSQIRAATKSTSTTSGDAGKLPCGLAPWTDQPVDAQGRAKFTVSVTYYVKNPRAGGKAMGCAPGNGPFDEGEGTRVPRFAVLKSTGRVNATRTSGSRGWRTLESTYVFQTNDVNIVGGQIRIFPPSPTSSRMCMDAGSSNPSEGTPVRLQPCSNSTPPAESQVWAYRPDLSIMLVSSAKKSAVETTEGMCIDTLTAVADRKANDPIVLTTCGVADANLAAPYEDTPPGQRWSIDDNAHLRGSNNDATDVGSFCLDVSSQNAGTALLLKTCTGGTTDTKQTWVPSPNAGTGAAGVQNSQIVNYRQFATCFDVTGQNVNAAYVILYTCKQNPNASRVAWNQKVTPVPALGKGPTRTLLTMTTGGQRYCLKSPKSAGGYPRLEACSSNPTDVPTSEYWWTVSQRYTDGSAELPYSDRYTIKDGSPNGGLCLSLGDAGDKHDGQYFKLVTNACDGSTTQKWNADPSGLSASLTDTRETDQDMNGTP